MIQNELLQIIADLIRERIANNVRASGWCGIIVDETSDISRTEPKVPHWLSFALNGTKKEAFIDFYSTKSTVGEALCELVKSAITELNLDLTRDSQQEWKSASLSVSTSTVTYMISTSPCRIL